MTSAERTDVHAPNRIRPEDYAFVGSFVNHPPTDLAGDEIDVETPLWPVPGLEPMTFEEALSNERSPDRAYSELDRCDHCGQRVNYAAVYRHTPTEQFVVLGHRCADSIMGYEGRRALEASRQRDLLAASRKDAAEEAERKERLAEAKRLYPDAYQVLDGYDGSNGFILNVAAKLAETSNLTEAQAGKVVEAHERDHREREERQRRREAGEDQPVPGNPGEAAKGATVEGLVVKAQEREDPYAKGGAGRWGRPYKVAITVRDDRGFVVWGHAPEVLHALDTPEGRRDIEKGDRVRFVANLEAKKSDPYFGFFKRPRKAEVLVYREPPQPDPEVVEAAERQAERDDVRAVVKEVRERLREAGEAPDTFHARRAVTILDDLVEGGYDGAVAVAKLWWEKTGGREVSSFRKEWDAVRRENALGAYRALGDLVGDGEETAEGLAGHLGRLADTYIALGGAPQDVGR